MRSTAVSDTGRSTRSILIIETVLGRRRDTLIGGVLWEEHPRWIGTATEIAHDRDVVKQQAEHFGSCWSPVLRLGELLFHQGDHLTAALRR